MQSLKEFKTQVNTLASLEHPNLCKVIGYYAREDSNGRMLVYERLHHGSLDKVLFGRSDGRFMDWSKRLKVALGAARGLAFLHDEGPFQVGTPWSIVLWHYTSFVFNFIWLWTTLSCCFVFKLYCVSICFQAMYSEFSTSSIQIDKDFTAKLSGYGCVEFNTEEVISNAPVVCSCLSVV